MPNTADLGRLVRKQTPVNAGETQLQTKDYYYDGVRRIQEVISRPVDPDVPGGGPGGTFLTGGGSRNDELAMGRADGGDPSQSLQGGIGITPDPSPGPTSETWTDREYVYGPGYVDEFICQIDRDGAALFMVQDGNDNVVALVSGGCEDGVAPEDCPLPPPGTLLEQYVYEPYGAVSIAENLDTAPDGTSLHAANRVGHQGLFFERFAGDYTTQPLSPTDGAGLYFNRNRFYSPTLGRFIQRDPNETALPILTALATNAETLAVAFGPFDAQALYSNGPNLYQYEASNPVNNRDPSGLAPDDDSNELDDWLGLPGQIGDRFERFRNSTSLYSTLTNIAINAAFDWTGNDTFDIAMEAIARLGSCIRGEEPGLTPRAIICGAFDIFDVQKLPPDQLMRRPRTRGRAPTGIDGESVEIHHVNQKPEGPFVEMLASKHQQLRNPKPGLTPKERDLFNNARRRYWEREWDSGRFNSLPE